MSSTTIWHAVRSLPAVGPITECRARVGAGVAVIVFVFAWILAKSAHGSHALGWVLRLRSPYSVAFSLGDFFAPFFIVPRHDVRLDVARVCVPWAIERLLIASPSEERAAIAIGKKFKNPRNTGYGNRALLLCNLDNCSFAD